MSTPILPFAVWAPGTNQNSIPANDNSLRNQILNGLVIADDVDAQPGSPADGDIYIITGAATGAAWSTFDEFDLAIFSDGTWYAFAPVEGIVVNLDGAAVGWNGTDYVAFGGIPDAPSDGTGYVRKDGAWEPESAGGGGREDVSSLATSGSVAIDYALGDYFTLALAGNVTGFTFSNLPGSGKGATLMIRITQDTTPRTVAWPASFRWAGGGAGAVSTGSGAVDVLAITTFDNGTTWQATLAKAFA